MPQWLSQSVVGAGWSIALKCAIRKQMGAPVMVKRRCRWNALALIWSLLAVTLAGCVAPGASGSATATRPAAGAATTPAPSASWQANVSAPDTTTSFTFAPSAPQIGYLCTGEPTQRIKGPRLYKTSDGGNTWKAVTTEPSGDLPCRVFVNALLQTMSFSSRSLNRAPTRGRRLRRHSGAARTADGHGSRLR